MAFLNWKIAGAAGEGIKVSGLMLQKTAFRAGFYSYGSTEYPSLIRGGHNTFEVVISNEPVASGRIKVDLLVDLKASTIASLPFPLADLAKQSGNLLTKNTVALGGSCFLLGLDLSLLKAVIKEAFAGKDQTIIDQNYQAAQLGFDFAAKNYSDKKLKLDAPKQPLNNKIMLNGNEALALGAVAGGMKFYCAYPMTPSTPILHYLAAKAEKLGIVVNHAEDEIGVINMAIGAGAGGVRSMVATSGGGFSLMTEGLGLAGGTETPVVIILGMRPGPASGMPTWSGQGDLLFAINAAQDEFPRIVLAPGDPQEAFALAAKAQNLAEKYQLPVIILSDKNLGEGYYTTNRPADKHHNQRYSLASGLTESDQPFARYQVTESGISPRPLPGTPGGIHLINSYEHDELGYATEVAAERTKQMNKRLTKLKTILASPDLIGPKRYGPTTAKTTIISWGSNKGAIIDALEQLPDTNFIHFSWLWPFPQNQFLSLIAGKPRLMTVEANATGQISKLIAQETGVIIKDNLLKYDGRQFYSEEIIEAVKKL
ncbi:MAG: 2-oxoacid:acceptor oxidoreductase subunit alpha [Patescibacteria group bacterium]|nr:2-oxoacid:acceptor oxidoreductase subunit alpha [Patescibacteria group bacterium]